MKEIKEVKKKKVMSLFSGVGGLEQGLENCELVGLSEIEKSACAILKYHYKVKNYGDITKIDSKDLPDFDMLVGGSPCQDLSTAGKRAGLNNGKKSSLFFHYVRILKEKSPSTFIWENVKGTFSSTKGYDFLAVQKEFMEAGYHIQWQLLDSEDFNVPQSRSRVFFVGAKKVEDLPGLLNIVNSQKHINQSLKFSTFCGSLMIDGILQTITRSYGKLSGNGTKIYELNELENIEKLEREALEEIIKLNKNNHIRIITPVEAELAMGWKKNHTKYGIMNDKVIEMKDSHRYKACGNGIVSNCIKEIMKPHKFKLKQEDNLDFLSFIKEKEGSFLIKKLSLKKDDYIINNKKIYIKSLTFIKKLLNQKDLNNSIKVYNPKLGIKTKDCICLSYEKSEMRVYKSKKKMFSEVKEKNVKKDYYLSVNDCIYLLKKLKN